MSGLYDKIFAKGHNVSLQMLAQLDAFVKQLNFDLLSLNKIFLVHDFFELSVLFTCQSKFWNLSSENESARFGKELNWIHETYLILKLEVITKKLEWPQWED